MLTAVVGGFFFTFTAASSLLPDLQRLFDILFSAISSAALIIGGIWAYFKFVVGRIFQANVEPRITGEVSRVGKEIYLITNANVKNIGSSRIDIDHGHTVLRVLTAESAPYGTNGRITWTHFRTEFMLEDHDLLEPGETALDTMFFQLRDHNYVAIRLDAYVTSTKREYWVGRSIVNLVSEIDNSGR